ncbi:MAG: hypothetical protein A2566_02290 [Candidatus Zambryskibacteria bacterium RIFOXYD1_FULL_40_13]|nr:MAG: Polysaccharide biosynthesis protein [Parcubacteria group bacterium GW2011_GWC1_39_12]KKR19043.1 MAG: Polysaccharide biosynthesis protein [Parcubacteria group bacterium GW2011_GWF1_39_37]KKR35610.1 MAG: Polysaccharide biosynthesis protein [Parcubacteria group bacterium GW2011_GWC2_40_10]KKR52021.1 MAG: Polysaccharide biosynthesis protein [Parcubacteria group bacterium GW2011_GWE1_40_20]KKR68787.1 MAG: Polysaccharide biosynthesis protein [Parcubacteria group bacterium GW2011_GWF2_40_69]K
MERIKKHGVNGLHWLEQYLQTDMVYVAKSGFWLTVGQVVSVMLAFGMSVFFANFIPKEVYGQYKFILSATGILGALSLSGMGNVVIQAVAKGKEGMLKEAVFTTLKWGSIMLVVGLAGSAYYFINGNSVLGFSMLIASISLPLSNSFNLYGGYFSGKRDFKSSTLYWIVAQTILSIGIVVVAILTKNALALVAVYFAISAISAVCGYYYVTRRNHLNSERDDSFMSYGKHVSFMNFFGTLANQLDKILVFHYLGAANLAIYAFSQAIPEQIKGSFKNLFNIALPKYAVLEDQDLRKSILKKTWQLMIITSVIVVAYILVAPFIFQFFFPQYTDAVIYSQIYMLGLIAIPGISLFGTYFQIKKATRTMYKLTIVSNVTTIILTFILIYNFGLKGAVIENGISWLIMLGVHYYYFSTHKED